MEFVWNEIQAEDIRQQSVAAMQGTYECMREQALVFTNQTKDLEVEVAAIESTLPIMKSETRTGTTTSTQTDADGNSYEVDETYYYTVEVVDQAATSAAQAQIAEMKHRVEELGRAAKALEMAAQMLQDKIAATNALFCKLHSLAVETDEASAAKMREIKGRIETYIAKIGNIRDSFGNKFTTEADGTVYFGSSSGSILTNPTNFAEIPWAWLGDVLSHSASQITVREFSLLAFYFTLASTPASQERFLNLMAEPVDISTSFGTLPNLHNVVPYTVCPQKIAGIRAHLNIKIAVNMRVQMSLKSDDPLFKSLAETNQSLMQQSTLLAVAGEIATISQERRQDPPWMWQRVLNCQGNGPFRITEHAIIPGGITLTVGHGDLWRNGVPPNDRGGIMLYNNISNRGNNPVHIRPALEHAGIYSAARSLAGHNFNVSHQFNLSTHLASGAADLTLSLLTMGLSDGVSFALDTAQIFTAIPGARAEARGVQSDFRQAMDDIALGLYHKNFRLAGVIVEEAGIRRRDPIKWEVFSWPTVYTFGAVDALNQVSPAFVEQHPRVVIPQFSYQQFLSNPRIAVGVFDADNLCTCGTCGNRRQDPSVARGCRHTKDAFIRDLYNQIRTNERNRQLLPLPEHQSQPQATPHAPIMYDQAVELDIV